jgi:ribosomal protein S27AE
MMSQGIPMTKNEILRHAGNASAVLKDSMIFHEFNMAIGVGEFINESCPKCGATLLANKRGDKWCSNAGGVGMSACGYELDISNMHPLKRSPPV